MQLSKVVLALGIAATSVSATAILPRAAAGTPDVPMCTNQDPTCNIYNGVSICVPKCYRVVGNIYPAPSVVVSSGSSGSNVSVNAGGTSVNSSTNSDGSSSSSSSSNNGDNSVSAGVINAPTFDNGLGSSTSSVGSSSSTGDGSTDGSNSVSSGVTNIPTFNRRSANFINCNFATLKCTDGKQLTGCLIQGTSANQVDEQVGDNCGAAQGDGRSSGASVPRGISTTTITQHSSSARSRAATDVRLHAVGALLAVGAIVNALF